MFSLSVAHNVSTEPEWNPRSENQVADFISHLQDLDDWQLNPSVFYSLQVRWGPCTIDRFASYYNTGSIAAIITQDQKRLMHLLVIGVLR